MRRATKRRVQLFLWLVLAGALIGTAYGSVIGHIFRETGLIGGAIGAIDGAAITVSITAIEIFALRTRWGRAVQHAPFLVTFGLKWVAYGVLISIINLRSLGVFLLGLVALAAPLPVSVALWSVAFSFAVAFAFLFVFQVSQIVGPRNLGHIVLGRYHQPHLEDRFFLFIDIRGSTTLAERLVGDEMVVTWTGATGRRGAGPLACFFAIEAALEAAAPEFEREFSVVPQLRAALHAGPVISGEIGDTKREIVFHGDVMNTAARLEQATRDLDRQFLVSAYALSQLSGTERYAREALGPRTLRGREAPVEIYAVTAAR